MSEVAAEPTYTIEQVARLLSLQEANILSLVRSGRLKAHTVLIGKRQKDGRRPSALTISATDLRHSLQEHWRGTTDETQRSKSVDLVMRDADTLYERHNPLFLTPDQLEGALKNYLFGRKPYVAASPIALSRKIHAGEVEGLDHGCTTRLRIFTPSFFQEFYKQFWQTRMMACANLNMPFVLSIWTGPYRHEALQENISDVLKEDCEKFPHDLLRVRMVSTASQFHTLLATEPGHCVALDEGYVMREASIEAITREVREKGITVDCFALHETDDRLAAGYLVHDFPYISMGWRKSYGW